jgi:hypothetical protein
VRSSLRSLWESRETSGGWSCLVNMGVLRSRQIVESSCRKDQARARSTFQRQSPPFLGPQMPFTLRVARVGCTVECSWTANGLVKGEAAVIRSDRWVGVGVHVPISVCDVLSRKVDENREQDQQHQDRHPCHHGPRDGAVITSILPHRIHCCLTKEPLERRRPWCTCSIEGRDMEVGESG